MPIAAAFVVAGCAAYPAAVGVARVALPARPIAASPASRAGGADALGRWPAGRSLAGWRPLDVARHTGRPASGLRAPAAARARIVAAYEGYWRATDAALDSRSPARARTIIGGFVPPGAVAILMRAFTRLWRRDEVGYGLPVFHILTVTVTGPGIAAVHDCLDLSRLALQNYRTGQVVGAIGQSHYNLITTLVRQRGRWLVTGSIPVVASCAY
ncbi:MAG: hypothetical protein ACYCVZ_05265 [Streptosporangiaceae bacterium]